MKKRIAYIINHSAFFYSHIFDIAKHAKKKDYEIKLFCGKAASKEMDNYADRKLSINKIKVSKISFNSSTVNFANEIFGFLELVRSLKEYKPDIVHCASPKGILFGGLACSFLKIKSLVIFNSGMGFLFSNKLNIFYKFLKIMYITLLKLIVMKHKNKKIIVENINDYNFLKVNYKLKKSELSLIKGSGVNLEKFSFIKKNNSKIVLLPARIVKEKGIIEFIYAAKSIKSIYPDWQFLIAGAIDYNKKSKLNIDKLKILNDKNQVKILGYVKNILKIYNKCAIVCLPSYREGLSRILQEAAAKGLPIVTSNVVGCRDAIIPNKTGFLCKPKNIKSLEKKLIELISNKNKRIRFGFNGRKLAEKEFDLKDVIKKNLIIYNKLINNEK